MPVKKGNRKSKTQRIVKFGTGHILVPTKMLYKGHVVNTLTHRGNLSTHGGSHAFLLNGLQNLRGASYVRKSAKIVRTKYSKPFGYM